MSAIPGAASFRMESDFLDDQLNEIFGPTFAPVLEHEVRSALHSDLHQALHTDPEAALVVLGRFLRGGDKVAIVFGALASRLRKLGRCEEAMELAKTIDKLMPVAGSLSGSSA